MTRKLFFLERLLYGDGRAPFHAVFPIRISGAPALQNLRRGLEKVQSKHPLLQSRIVQDERGVPHFVADGQAAPIGIRIVDRKADDDWIHESMQEWVTPFDMEKGPLIRVVFLRGHSNYDLLLVFHHCICNGSSCILLMQEILTLLDEPEAEIGRYSHFITPEELLAENPADRGARRKAKLKSLLFHAFFSLKAAMVDKKNIVSICREKDYLVNWKLDEATSTAIYNHCKQLGVTVNSALCVAFLSAFRDVKGEANYNKVTCPVDIRKYLPAAKRNDLFSFGLAIDLEMGKKSPAGFRERAVSMHKEAVEKMSKLNIAEFLMPMEYSHAAIRPLMKVLQHGKRKTNLILSNMGRLELKNDYRSFRIEAVYSPTVIGSFGDPTDIVTTTFGGCMDFCFVSNGEFVPYADALAIKDRAMELLIPK